MDIPTPRDSVASTNNGRFSILSNGAKKDLESGTVQEKITPYVYLVCAFAAFGSFVWGVDQNVFGPIEIKKGFSEEFCSTDTDSSGQWGSTEACMGKLADDNGSHVPEGMTNFLSNGVSLPNFGCMIASFLFAPYLNSFLGRRWSLLIGCVLVIGFQTLAISNNNITSFYIARIGSGLSYGTLCYTAPIYIAEMAPPSIRGGLGCLFQLFTVIGGMMTPLVASVVNDWKIIFMLPAVPAIIVIIGVFFFPESPRFLMRKHGASKARPALQKLRQCDDVEQELAEIEEAQNDNPKTAPWKVLFMDKSIRRRIIVGSVLQLCQQATGINVMIQQGPKLYVQAGVQINGNLANFINQLFNLVGTLILIAIVDKVGRRKLLMVAAVGMFAFMGAGTIVGYTALGTALNPNVAGGWAVFALINVFFFSFALAWGGIPWMYPTEIFPMDVKEKALSCTVLAQFLGTYVISKIAAFQIDGWGIPATMLFYTVMLALDCLFVFFFVPETKGVAIEDMDKLFGPRTYEY